MKEVAKTFTAMAMSSSMQTILNRQSPHPELDAIMDTLLEHWSMDLYSRRPGPALLENGVLSPTDLDLACFLSALADRHAVINLPTYHSRRPKTEREGERVLSNKNRHGKISSLSANKEVFSFSVKIEDMNVISSPSTNTTDTPNAEQEDKVGAFRNFMLVDIDGSWHDGWKSIEFMPNRKENSFLADKNLWTGHTVVFKNFVHPNRWTSFYGQYYFLSKALVQRLEEENKFLREQEKAMLAAGIYFPPKGEEGAKKEWAATTKGESKSEDVTAFECEVDAPFHGSFNAPARDVHSLVANADRIRRLTYTTLPKLRFALRATELAFFKAKMSEAGFPGWIKGASWEEGYTLTGKRTAWNRLVLAQLFPGQPGFALRYRTYTKKEQVAV